MNVDQSVIDRAYACVATRNGATALYLSRPNTKGFNNIKTGKGSTAFKSAAVTAVNKLRNVAGSARDYVTSTGDAFSCTREGVGAVIVMKGSGNISIANGGGYCPAGTYTDVVSGGSFTVTSSTISGNVGSSGIAVIYKGGSTGGAVALAVILLPLTSSIAILSIATVGHHMYGHGTPIMAMRIVMPTVHGLVTS